MIKKILFVLLSAGSLFAASTTKMGEKGWGRTVYFGDDSSTTILFLGNIVYMDSANTGTYKRIDNTSDSCSLVLDFVSGFSTLPAWKYELSFDLKAKSADSAQVVFEIESRDNDFAGTAENWVKFGKSTGYGDVAISDSVLSNTAGSTSYAREKHLFFITGAQGRFCPDDVTATSNDSLWVTNPRVRLQ